MSAANIVREAALALRGGEAQKAVDLVRSLGQEADLPEEARFVWGLAELAREAWPEAYRLFARLAEDKPSAPLYLFNLALVQEKLGRTDEALRLHEACVAMGAGTGETFGNLSNLYRAKGRYVEAEEAARKALEKGAPRDAALNCRALALAALGRRGEAEALWQEVLARDPDKAELWANRANAAADARAFDEAFAFFAKARALDDTAILRRDEGMARLLAGDTKKGAALYEARLDLPRAFAPPAGVQRWRGEDLRGKTLLLLSEQGLGDTIQFCRAGNLLAEKGVTLLWGVQEALVPFLTGRVPGRVFERFAEKPKADFFLPLGSVPLALEAEVFGGGAYLPAPQGAPLSEPRPRIGLIWAGASVHLRDAERSLPLAALAPVWEAFPHASFFAPFKGPALAEIEKLGAPVRSLEPRLKDFAEAASLMAQMDALISVDTAGAHLAGALGVKTALLLPFVPDWRWGVAGERTPLYDSFVLCRQRERGQWGEAITDAINNLRRVL